MSRLAELEGHSLGPAEVAWDERDTLLYALGVGAGQADPAECLALTTENSAGIRHIVLPTFAIGLLQYFEPAIPFGDIGPGNRLHAEQQLDMFGVIPSTGCGTVTKTVTNVYDKGKAAIVVVVSELILAGTTTPLARSTSSVFIRGAGGFGGDRGPSDSTKPPKREPDRELRASTRHDQALLFRLSGDRNPLHSDPVAAAPFGFAKPILHGLCTYGIAARLLFETLCDGDPERFRSIGGRFTKPVIPGEQLTVPVWVEEDAARFQVLDQSGGVVIDKGKIDMQPVN